MKKFFALVLMVSSLTAWAAPPAKFESRVEAVRTAAEVPGMAIAIVENGAVTLARGFGLRKLGSPEKVDGDTIFMTGSTGKAMTTAALATLVDAGKLKWDDRVTDHIPGFQMYDPWVTREMTVRDLLVHRSGLGLGAGDLLVIPRGTLSRAEVVKRLRFIKPATSFRSGYAYDNILYIVAGHVIDQVSGQPYEDYVREHLFKPAGMLHSTSDEAHRFATANRASPHARTGGARSRHRTAEVARRARQSRAVLDTGGIARHQRQRSRAMAADPAGEGQGARGRAALQRGIERRDVDAANDRTHRARAARPRGDDAELPAIRAGLGGARLRRRQDPLAFGRCVRIRHRRRVDPRRRMSASRSTQNSEDGQVTLRAHVRAARSLSRRPTNDWPARITKFRKERFAAAVAAVNAKSAAARRSRSRRCPWSSMPVTTSDAWYGAIAIEVRVRKGTHDRLHAIRPHGRHPPALAVRHVHRALRRSKRSNPPT